MLSNAFQRLIGSKNAVTFHQVFSTYGKLHRILKSTLNESITGDISALDWNTLGILAKSDEPKKYGDIAEELGVEAPVVTELLSHLESLKCIKIQTHPVDKRAKMVKITRKGVKMFEAIEQTNNTKYEDLLKNISEDDLQKMDTLYAEIEKIGNSTTNDSKS
ncbi:MAG: MarR family winged helix-turn-helix transcriptional regulator [Weeksellaceae bacterium]